MTPVEEEEEGRDVIEILESGDPDTLAEAVARLRQLRTKFRTSYRYIVGEWGGGRRAKDTVDGQFVTKEEVTKYLEAEDF